MPISMYFLRKSDNVYGGSVSAQDDDVPSELGSLERGVEFFNEMFGRDLVSLEDVPCNEIS